MKKKTTETKSKRRTKVKQMSNPEAKLTPEQTRKVKGGAAETTQRVGGGTDSIWIDLGYPVRRASKT